MSRLWDESTGGPRSSYTSQPVFFLRWPPLSLFAQFRSAAFRSEESSLQSTPCMGDVECIPNQTAPTVSDIDYTQTIIASLLQMALSFLLHARVIYQRIGRTAVAWQLHVNI